MKTCSVPAFDELFWHIICQGDDMKRDNDYLRDLLIEFIESDEWIHLDVMTLSATPEQRKRHYHVLLLIDAGFMQAVGEGTVRVTNSGQDFAALTAESKTWEATKKAASILGGASVQMLFRIAEGYARQKLADFGIPFG